MPASGKGFSSQAAAEPEQFAADRVKTVKRNEAFTCRNCGEVNPPAPQTCRNHCRKCLFSRHVDDKLPGDRASTCHELMSPITVEHDSKREWMITHKCLRCGKVQRNKVAEDDDFD